MRKSWGERSKDGDDEPQLVAVAVEAGKSSQNALKWAADHVLSREMTFFLVHVRRKVATPAGSQVPTSEAECVAPTFLEKIDIHTKNILLPFQCFCNRRGLQCKEVILNEGDVPKAIVDFVANQFVDKLVVGASSRSALSRTFKSDVPTSVSKTAPDFCSVFVISKGKVLSTRPARHPNMHPVRQTLEIESPRNQFQSVKSDPVAGQYKEATGRFGHFKISNN